jgi:RHS repeat-associated protein
VKEQNVAGAAVTNTHFVWDGMAMVQWQNTAGVAQRNLFDEGEQDVATGEKLIYVKDHLGSVRGWHRLSDGARGEADYSAWGVRTVVSNTTGTLPVRSFTGHYQHAASGLVLAPYRGYDAELGRWLSEDPIGEEGGVNLYGYVGNGVVMWVDPLGLETFIIDRPLNPTGKTELPSKPTRSWIAHRFVCVTQPDGSLITVSWGNKYDQDGNGLWSFNAPEDVSAAKHALANGNQGMSYGSKIDPFVPIALGKILMNGSSSHPWEMQNNCQHEAYQLVRSANELMMKTYYPEFFQPK